MKRLRTSDPLTADDVAERLNRSALRTLALLMEIRQSGELNAEVRASRYLTNVLDMLGDEIAQHW